MTTELQLYNSWSRRLEPLEPLEAGKLRIYACGPTVYDYAHIGNFRFNVWVDILRRTLEWWGYDVTLVMNITDVDDKTIAGAARSGETLADYTARFTEAFFDDLKALRIRPAAHYPRATEHIEEMAALVEVLLAKGLAYEQDGSFYFRVGAFPDYGKLSRLDPAQLRATERVEGDEYGKEEARDFALWKAAKEGEPAWDTALGSGRPGWHLECSALSMKYLGETFDLHLGGVDLIFPHHENEIAQSAGATGRALARYWLHCAHLIVDGTKMSKSLGNQYTLRDLTDAGHDPLAIRYLLASVHYRKRLNFTFAALEQAKAATARLAELVLRLEQEMDALPERSPAGEPPGKAVPAERSPVGEPHGKAAPAERSRAGEPPGGGATDEGPGSRALAAARRGFAAALADDLNTSGALGHVFSLVRAANTALDEDRLSRDEGAAILDWLRSIDAIWAVLPAADELLERHLEIDGTRLVAIGPPIVEDAVEMVVARMRARAGRDFAAADQLRDRLQELGITLEDTAQGVRWHLGEP